MKSGFRKLIIDDMEFGWKYSGGGWILICDPNDKVHRIDVSDLTGWTHPDIERGQWKGYFKLGPGDIAKYVKENKLGYPSGLRGASAKRIFAGSNPVPNSNRVKKKLLNLKISL